MNATATVRIAVVLLLLAGGAQGQVPAVPGVEFPAGFRPPFDAANPLVVPAGTTVQLPTFNFFTISTTVNVPDSGGAWLGGVDRSGSGSRSSGLPGFGSRAGASGSSTGNVSVTAQIHDLRAMDKAMRSDATADAQAAQVQAWAARIERAKQSTAGRATMSVAEARRLGAAAR